MPYVIKLAGIAPAQIESQPGTPAIVGSFLRAYDPDAFEGRGSADWTVHAARALAFGSVAEALELYGRTSSVRPLRGDGRPNRPLTAATVEIVRVDDVGARHG